MTKARSHLQPKNRAERGEAGGRDNELSSTVRKVMRQYFKDLDGEKCTGIYNMVVAAVEKPMLEVVMNQAQGNQTRAAELLGMNRNTLRKKLQQHGLD
jgi:Fis family transcriptional regulator